MKNSDDNFDDNFAENFDKIPRKKSTENRENFGGNSPISRAIFVQNLTKKFGGNFALKNVNFSVKNGSITGFLGPNGAGKSTTINLLLGFLNSDGGEMRIFGEKISVGAVNSRNEIGFLSNSMALDKNLTVAQELKFYANLERGKSSEKLEKFDKKSDEKSRIWREKSQNPDGDSSNFSNSQNDNFAAREKSEKSEKIAEKSEILNNAKNLAKRLNLNLKSKIGGLSTGNYQKVGLIIALMKNPQILILDEPTNGLDPLIQAEFNKIILEMRDRGATIFISSHILSEIKEICDEFIFIRAGKIVAQMNQTELSAKSGETLKIDLTEKNREKILKILRENKIPFSRESGNLEKTFMEFYENNSENRENNSAKIDEKSDKNLEKK